MPAEMSRETVLSAARRACSDGRQPTMAQFAAAAGVGVRTLYRLFGSRQALLREAGITPTKEARERIRLIKGDTQRAGHNRSLANFARRRGTTARHRRRTATRFR